MCKQRLFVLCGLSKSSLEIGGKALGYIAVENSNGAWRLGIVERDGQLDVQRPDLIGKVRVARGYLELKEVGLQRAEGRFEAALHLRDLITTQRCCCLGWVLILVPE